MDGGSGGTNGSSSSSDLVPSNDAPSRVVSQDEVLEALCGL